MQINKIEKTAKWLVGLSVKIFSNITFKELPALRASSKSFLLAANMSLWFSINEFAKLKIISERSSGVKTCNALPPSRARQ